MDKNIISANVRFDEIELPETIYKYRIWHRDDHKRILTHNEIHFSRPLDLDSNTELVFRRDDGGISYEILYNYYYEKLKETQLLSELELEAEATKWAKNSPLKNPEHVQLQNDNFKKRLNCIFRIFSVSRHSDIERMWNEFGDNGYGFCVGFDSKKIIPPDFILPAGGHVNYYDKDDVPVFKPFYSDPNSYESVYDLLRIIFSLPKKLAHEDEYRLVQGFFTNKLIHVPQEAYKEIILGENIGEKEKSDITKIVEERFPNCKIIPL